MTGSDDVFVGKTTKPRFDDAPWSLMLVAVVIFWPESVTYFIDRGPQVDPSTVIIDLPPPTPDTQSVPIFQ